MTHKFNVGQTVVVNNRHAISDLKSDLLLDLQDGYITSVTHDKILRRLETKGAFYIKTITADRCYELADTKTGTAHIVVPEENLEHYIAQAP